MDEIFLFTDGSVNTKLNIGYGAILYTENINQSLKELEKRVLLKRITDTSSTKLELEILLMGLNIVIEKRKSIIVYTDSQNILHLPERRERLESNNYLTKKD